MNDLEKYFYTNSGNLIHKWRHYFEIYERHLARYRGREVYVVEVGVYQGGSLQMWKHYFGAHAKIYGVDINPACKLLEEDQITILIGDQEDRKFLQSLIRTIPRIDILIDDGGHTMRQQITTFEELFPHIEKNGVYVCEDLHTSYWPGWGGGYKKRDTFVEYSKNFIDALQAWFSRNPQKLAVSEFTKTVYAVHFYSSMLVIEKRPIEKPDDSKTGTPRLPDYITPQRLARPFFDWFRRKSRSAIRYIHSAKTKSVEIAKVFIKKF